MVEKSHIQQLFLSYAHCEFLNGEPVADDDGQELQSVAWLHENRFDDFLDEISQALGGVGRDAVMRAFLRHALRVLNEDSPSTLAGADDNRNASRIIDEIVRQRNGDEFLREKVTKLANGLPVPLGLQFK